MPTDPSPRRSPAGGHAAWAVPLALGALSLIATGALAMGPPASGPVALVFPPWWDGARIMRAASASGRLVRLGAAPFVVVVQPDAGSPGARARSGAWLVLNPGLLGGCAAPS